MVDSMLGKEDLQSDFLNISCIDLKNSTWIRQCKPDHALCTMAPVLKKISHFFFTISKKILFQLGFCENFQYLITFNEVLESVDGLQIRVNLANPKIKNSVVIIFDSNSGNVWRMIFQNPKKFSKYHFSFKCYSNLKYLRIFTDFRPFTNKMYGKNTYRIYSETV